MEYFASDLHLDHDPQSWDSPIWEMRGFTSARAFRDFATEYIYDTLKPGDHFYYLGDLALNSTDEFVQSVFDRLLKDIGIKMTYIWGNHETNVRRLYKQGKIEGDISFHTRWTGKIGTGISKRSRHMAILDHFPIGSWEYMARGSWMIHGHTHGGYPNSQPEDTPGLILDVGFENTWSYNKTPLLSAKEIESIMSKKKFRVVDRHHNPETINGRQQ